MFIACRGIPVLVGFLEADYAKYRFVIHIFLMKFEGEDCFGDVNLH